jgi:hypothetical protein
MWSTVESARISDQTAKADSQYLPMYKHAQSHTDRFNSAFTKYPVFMKPNSSLPYTKYFVSKPYSKPDSRPHTPLLHRHFTAILPSYPTNDLYGERERERPP